MSLRRTALLACVAASSLWLLPDLASAQTEPGVHVDPGSPEGREYAIPLTSARQQNTPKTRTTHTTTPRRRVVPRTTTTVERSTPPTTSTQPVAPTPHRSKPKPKPHARQRPVSSATVRPPAAPRAAVPASDTSSGVSSTGITAAVAGAVLLLGLALAAALRLRRRRAV